MAQNLPGSYFEEQTLQGQGSNPQDIRSRIKEFITQNPYTYTGDSPKHQLANYIQEKLPGARGLVGRYFGDPDAPLGDSPFGPGDLSMIPNLKNFGRFLTLWRKEKGGLKDVTGASVDPASSLANIHGWMRARRPQLAKQKHVGRTQIADIPPNEFGNEVAGNYTDSLVVEEMKKQALQDPELHKDILNFFNISKLDELKPWVSLNRQLEGDLAESVKTMTEEYFHALQDVKGRLPKLNEQRQYTGKAAKQALPFEAAADRAANTGFNDFLKFANLVNDPRIASAQKVRYLNLLSNMPEWFDEAGNFIHYPPGTFKGAYNIEYEKLRDMVKKGFVPK